MTGTCMCCGFAYALSIRTSTLPDHLANPYAPAGASELCDGSDLPPSRYFSESQAKRYNARWRPLAACRAIGDAAVVLDAVLAHRTEFDARLPDYVALALKGYRLAYPHTRIVTPWRWDPRGATRESRRSSFLPKLGDVYCVFCGELLISDIERASLPFLRGLAKSTPAALRELGDRVYQHTTPCALQCLAGMRSYAAPDVRRLPEETEAA